MSQRQTAKIVGVSRYTVSKVVNAAKVAQMDWEKLAKKSEQEIEDLLFPKVSHESFLYHARL